MKYLIIMLLLPCFACAQIETTNIVGTWVRTKVEMGDGSRIIDRIGTASGFLINTFAKDNTAYFSDDPIQGHLKLSYRFSDSIINVGQTSYKIIKLTNDSLIIIDYNQNLSYDRLRRFYFNKMESNHNPAKPIYNENIKDSVYNVTNYTFPQTAGAVEKVTTSLTKISTNGKLKLGFIIDKNGQLDDLIVLENDGLKNWMQKEITDQFFKTRKLWHPGYVNQNPVNTSVEFTLVFTDNNGMRMVKYITSFRLEKKHLKILSLAEMSEEGNDFNDAISLTKERKYEQALIKLARCIAIDELDINAYYLRASINFELGNRQAACDDWSKLADLGQVPATKSLKEYCGK